MNVWLGGGQKLVSRAKTWSALSSPTSDIEYCQCIFEEICFPLKADYFHPLKRVANFVVSTTVKGDQEFVGT
jgi:hypothetical protein